MKNCLVLTLLCLVLSFVNMKVIRQQHRLNVPNQKTQSVKNKNQLKKLVVTAPQRLAKKSKAQRLVEAQQDIMEAKLSGFEDASQSFMSQEEVADDLKKGKELYNFIQTTYADSKLYEEENVIYTSGNAKESVTKEQWVVNKMQKAQIVFSVLQEGVQIAKNVGDKIKEFTGNQAVLNALEYLGPYGSIIAKGMQLVDFCVVAQQKGIKAALIKTFVNIDQNNQILDAIKGTNVKVDALSSKMSTLFEELGQKNELNMAKQNAYESVEIMLYGLTQFEVMQKDCLEQNVKDDQFPYSINKARCELSQETFVNMLSSLNFDYHYSEILKIYSGETNMLGVDFFTQLSEVNKQNQDILKTHYNYFQNLIRSATLCLHTFKTLQAKIQILKMNQRKQINRIASKSTVQNIVDELEIIVLSSSCNNCQTLQFEYMVKIATGDTIFCKRMPGACSELEQKLSPEQMKIKEQAEKNAENVNYDWNPVIEQEFKKYNEGVDGEVTDDKKALKLELIKHNQVIPPKITSQYFFEIIHWSFTSEISDYGQLFKQKNALDKFDMKSKQCNQYREQTNSKSYGVRFQIALKSQKSKDDYQRRTKIIQEALSDYTKMYDEKFEALFSYKQLDCDYHVYEAMKPKLEQLDNYQFYCFSKYNTYEGQTFQYIYQFGGNEKREQLKWRFFTRHRYQVVTREDVNRFAAIVETKYNPVRIMVVHC